MNPLIFRWLIFFPLYTGIVAFIKPELFTTPTPWIIMLGYTLFSSLLYALFESTPRDRDRA